MSVSVWVLETLSIAILSIWLGFGFLYSQNKDFKRLWNFSKLLRLDCNNIRIYEYFYLIKGWEFGALGPFTHLAEINILWIIKNFQSVNCTDTGVLFFTVIYNVQSFFMFVSSGYLLYKTDSFKNWSMSIFKWLSTRKGLSKLTKDKSYEGARFDFVTYRFRTISDCTQYEPTQV